MNRLLLLRPANHSFIRPHIIFQRSLAKATRLKNPKSTQVSSPRVRRNSSPLRTTHLPPLQFLDGTTITAQEVSNLGLSESQKVYTNIVRAEPYFLTLIPQVALIAWKSCVRQHIAKVKRLSEADKTALVGLPDHPIFRTNSSISQLDALNVAKRLMPEWNALIVSMMRKHRTPWFRFGRPLVGRVPRSVRDLLGNVWFAYDVPTVEDAVHVKSSRGCRPSRFVHMPEAHPRYYTLSLYAHTLADNLPPIVAAIKDANQHQDQPLPKTISILDPSFPNEGRPAIDHPVITAQANHYRVLLSTRARYGPLMTATKDPAITQLPIFPRVTRPWTRVDPVVVRQLTSPAGSRILRFGGMQALLDRHTSLPDHFPTPAEGDAAEARSWVRATDTAGVTEVNLRALAASAQDTYAVLNYSPDQLRLSPSVLYTPQSPPAVARVASNFSPDAPTPPLPPRAQLVAIPPGRNTMGNLPPPRKWLGSDLVLEGSRIGNVLDLVPKFKITALSFSMFSFARPLALKRQLQPDEIDEFRDKMQQLHMPASAVLPHLPFFTPFSKNPAKVTDAVATLIGVARALRTLGLTQLELPSSVHKYEFLEPHAACRRIAEVINTVHAQVPGITIVLPLDASFKLAVPYRFEALREIISHVNDKTRVGVCLSTRLLLNAGYDITDAEKVHDVMMAFDRIVGRHYLLGLRLADVNNGFALKRSVTTGVGAGICHLDTFKYLLGSDWTDYMPIIDDAATTLLTIRQVDAQGSMWRLATQAAEEARVRRNEHVMDW